MKKFLALSSTICLLAFASCSKKDAVPEPAQPVVEKAESYMNGEDPCADPCAADACAAANPCGDACAADPCSPSASADEMMEDAGEEVAEGAEEVAEDVVEDVEAVL